MRRQAQRDTAPELALRSVLHKKGLRYRLQVPVPGLPRRSIDICFPRAKVAVFVDGCFWHGCPEHARRPKSNSAWWESKIQKNRRRDQETSAALKRDGWQVLRFWSHEDPWTAAHAVEAKLSSQQADIE